MSESVGGVRVREYDPSDFAACVEVFDTNVPKYFTSRERAEFVRFLGCLPGPYLVLTDEHGAVVGCGGFAIVDEHARADLCWGMVRLDAHGQGLGRVLTETRVERATRDKAVEVLALTTSQHTRGFYERLGFDCTSVTVDGFGPSLDRCDMRRDVSA